VRLSQRRRCRGRCSGTSIGLLRSQNCRHPPLCTLPEGWPSWMCWHLQRWWRCLCPCRRVALELAFSLLNEF
jgi:hypothetical protein